jgi:hypothetical protein
MAEIDLSHVISVTVSPQAIGLKMVNLSTIALVTNETPIAQDLGAYTIYRNTTAVARDWGSNSEVYQQAVAVFAQTPNILTANGYLVIIPMLPLVTEPATSGYSITAQGINVTSFSHVNGGEGEGDLPLGSFDIKVDGQAALQVTGLDFSDAGNTASVAAVIDAALATAAGGTATATCSAVGDKIQFTSVATGSTSSVEIVASTTPNTTDISGALYLNANNMQYVQGRAAYSGRERLVDTIIRTRPLVYYHAVLPCLTIDNTEALNAANYIQTREMMLGLASNATDCCDPDSLFETVRASGLKRTRCFAYWGESMLSARLMAAASLSRLLSVNFEGSNTALTTQLKSLNGIAPDPNITETLFNKAEAVGADLYCSFSGVPACVSNGANEYLDNVYNDNWLITALQVAGFNALRQTNTKIPQTQAGVDALVTAYKNVLVAGVNNGCFAAGKWGITDTFGDPERFKTNIETFGYYIYATPLNEQSQAERDARKAPFISIAVKRAGAIHSSNIIVYINN